MTVVSPSKGKSRTLLYSVVEEGNIHKGVFPPARKTIAAPRPDCAWPVQAFKTDSAAAYETAAEAERGLREEAIRIFP